MRVLVAGAGATGAVFGARLIEAGADVEFLARPARAALLRERGLAVRAPDWTFERRVNASSAAELGARYDVALLAFKAYDLEEAVTSIARSLEGTAAVVPLLNGVAHYAWLDRALGAGRVAGGCCHLSASVAADGTVHQSSPYARIAFGARPGAAPALADALAALERELAGGPVQCVRSGAILQEVWEKFAFLAALAALTCLMRSAVGDLMAAESGAALAEEMFDCCAAVAASEGFAMREAPRHEYLNALTAPGSSLTASMLRDLEDGRRLEAEPIVGDMLRRARRAGQPAKLLEIAYAHLQARDARLAREQAARTIQAR